MFDSDGKPVYPKKKPGSIVRDMLRLKTVHILPPQEVCNDQECQARWPLLHAKRGRRVPVRIFKAEKGRWF